MKSSISELYYGNLYPFLTYKPALEETMRLLKATGGRCDRFRERLPEEMRKEFMDIGEDLLRLWFDSPISFSIRHRRQWHF